jgi:hypothetical protein
MDYIKYFSYGILAAFGALVLQFILIILFFSNVSAYGEIMPISIPIILAAAFIEEALKYAFIRKIYYGIEDKAKIMFCSLMVGLGFSSVELLSNLAKNKSADDLGNVYLWGVLFLHLATSGFIGLMFLKLGKKDSGFATIVLAAAIVIHISYNLAVLYLFK